MGDYFVDVKCKQKDVKYEVNVPKFYKLSNSNVFKKCPAIKFYDLDGRVDYTVSYILCYERVK